MIASWTARQFASKQATGVYCLSQRNPWLPRPHTAVPQDQKSIAVRPQQPQHSNNRYFRELCLVIQRVLAYCYVTYLIELATDLGERLIGWLHNSSQSA
jgi:hypothetical protein